MQVPFQLNRRPLSEPASALLLLSTDASELLAVCAELGYDPLPDVFPIADGFLLLLEAQTAKTFARTLRLRSEGKNLLLPVDADLVPQLHAEEASGLTRDRGVAILPGGRALAFDPRAPLDITRLLSVGSVKRDGWESLPQPRLLAENIRSITLDLPQENAESAIAPGGEGIGTEDPRPQAAGAGKTAANRARMSFGRMLSGLGKALGLDKLKKAGERMIEKAIEAAPRLAENIYGGQEAALRDLLKKFRDGKTDEALKRAIPKGDVTSYRGQAESGSQLPFHDLRYSLSNILSGVGSGPASFWYGHDDVVANLYREYRKAAEEATRRGDFRRAAFIYGKLLSEWREAADVLARGALHHDAAILYRDKLGDQLKAANQFEAGGEFDAAFKIYDQLADHERAGDLLRRIGEEERAVERYLQAADVMIRNNRGELAAGEFVMRKTQRAQLAEIYFAAGWSRRNLSLQSGNAISCSLHLARIYSQRDPPDDLFALVGEGEAFFAVPGNSGPAGQFFNEVARLASQPPLEPRRDELRDRCLMALAAKVREYAESDDRPGTVVSRLLGETRVWEAPLVRDAAFALKAAQKQPRRVERSDQSLTLLHLCSSTVTAARVAPSSGEVFAGFESGDVVGFRATDSRVLKVGKCPGPVSALATDMAGDLVVAEFSQGAEVWLVSFVREGKNDYHTGSGRRLQTRRTTGLAPLIVGDLLVVRSGGGPEDLSLYRGADLLPVHTVEGNDDEAWPIDLPLPEQPPGCTGTSMLVFEKGGADLCWFTAGSKVTSHLVAGSFVDWLPGQTEDNTLHKPRLAWGHDGPGIVEITGLNENHALYWLRLSLGPQQNEKLKMLATGCREGYRTASLMRNSRVVGITGANRMIWLRAEGSKLAEWAPSLSLTSLSPAVACFYTRPTEEVIVFLANGYLIRVPSPS
jgi:MoxR-vWA-beta-propeller ternary system domain bpX3